MPIVQVRKLKLWPEKLAFLIALSGAGFERGPSFSSWSSVLSLSMPTCRLMLCRECRDGSEQPRVLQQDSSGSTSRQHAGF